jgi:hypothetical protein
MLFGYFFCFNASQPSPPPLLCCGMVHANVGQKVMPLFSFKVIFVPFFTYNELVTSQDHPQHTTNPINTATMVVEPLTPPAAWI